ncbi:nitric oxide reductase domain protein [Burkholderia pseudomallei]|nr:nitric oxide reductase domain protein [Burkholderia pseudomallei]
MDVGELLLHLSLLRDRPVRVSPLHPRRRSRHDGPHARALSRANAQPAQGRQVFSGRRGGAAAADRGRRDPRPLLHRSHELLRHPLRRRAAVQFLAQHPHSGADRMDRPVVDRRRAVSRARDQRPGSARPGAAGRRAVLGHRGDRRRRADRRLSRHHGRDRERLVLVRQSGAVVPRAGALLADRLLHRPRVLERADPAGVVARPRRAQAGGAPVLDRTHPAGAPHLGVHDQYRAAVRVRHDSAAA